jgi:hypothetical protein
LRFQDETDPEKITGDQFLDELYVEPRFSGKVTDVVGWTANFQASGRTTDGLPGTVDTTTGIAGGQGAPVFRPDDVIGTGVLTGLSAKLSPACYDLLAILDLFLDDRLWISTDDEGDSFRDRVLHFPDDQLPAQLLGAAVAKLVELRKMMTRIHIQERHRNVRRAKRFLRETQEADRVLAAGKQERGAFEFPRHFPHDVNRFGLEMLEVIQVVALHVQ